MPLPKVLYIVGPTSSGKTSLSLQLAKQFNGEIVNADARQIYRGFDIGTGKPKGEWQEQEGRSVYVVEGIPHHLIDHLDPTEISTVAEWKIAATKVIQDIVSRGCLPILVGGTGMYVQSLVDNFELPAVAPQPELRARMEKMSLPELVAELKDVDPESAEFVDLQNPRRVMRAIEVARATGRSFGELRRKQAAVIDPLFIGLQHAPEVLRERINTTIDQMLAAGWIEEVEVLHAKGIPWGAPAMTSLGYREIGSYLRGEYSKEQMIQKIQIYTWQYARRQMTWFRKESRIQWIMNDNQAVPLIKKWLENI
jgi:tRNA dimethylallyltransferase